MNNRVYNFSGGPSVLPVAVLEKAAAEMLNYEGTGMSIMEMSHRSQAFDTIIKEAESNLRKLMDIPDDYEVLFLQGGGTLQFSMVPLNLMTGSKKSDFVITGSWADKASKEAMKYGDVNIIASSKDSNYSYIPKFSASDIRQDADYAYITYNNTIYGTKYPQIPDVGDVTLVSDISSCILCERLDVKKFGLLFAGAQKNIGPSGLTIVIVKKELVGKAGSDVPVYLDYETHVSGGSMYNTPPTWCIYIAGEVFKELLKNGGIETIERKNIEKAKKLYDYIDSSKLYNAPAAVEDRSPMNVVFVTGNPDLDKKFVEEAKSYGLYELGGHRSIGGMRASIYNAMPAEGVDALIDFMKKFEEENI